MCRHRTQRAGREQLISHGPYEVGKDEIRGRAGSLVETFAHASLSEYPLSVIHRERLRSGLLAQAQLEKPESGACSSLGSCQSPPHRFHSALPVRGLGRRDVWLWGLDIKASWVGGPQKD